MTSVLEREVQPSTSGTTEAPAVPFDLAVVGRVLLAVLSGTAGAIHLAMVPSHFALSTAEGIGFAVAGWVQLSIAVLLLVRPTRLVVLGAIAVNAAAIGAWGFSRIWGLPFGSHAWHPETSSFIDLAAVGLAAAFVVAAVGLLLRPGFGRGWDRQRLALGAVVPLAILALTSAALASPSARDHASGSHGTHGAEAGATGGAAAHDDAHGGAEGANAAALTGLDDLENGHQEHGGNGGAIDPKDPNQTALAVQLAQTAKLIEKYPTVADVEAAGYRRAGPFVPGLGTHYVGLGNTDVGDDMLEGVDGPMSPTIIYDGVEPTSPIAGFMYLSFAGRSGTAPEGFIGDADIWHYHTNTCVVFTENGIDSPLGADGDATQEQCAKFGGSLIQNTGYMVHVWTVPGYESPRGTFSNVNPAITCPDGTYFTLPKDDWGVKTSACRNTGKSS
ncbi:MAG: hypothetical protein R6X23_14610 [Acidimicrobiia bacterium]